MPETEGRVWRSVYGTMHPESIHCTQAGCEEIMPNPETAPRQMRGTGCPPPRTWPCKHDGDHDEIDACVGGIHDCTPITEPTALGTPEGVEAAVERVMMVVMELCVEEAKRRHPVYLPHIERIAATIRAELTARAEGPAQQRVEVVERRLTIEREHVGALKVAGNDVAAALAAFMENCEVVDVEAVEHCNAQIERWVQLVQPAALLPTEGMVVPTSDPRDVREDWAASPSAAPLGFTPYHPDFTGHHVSGRTVPEEEPAPTNPDALVELREAVHRAYGIHNQPDASGGCCRASVWYRDCPNIAAALDALIAEAQRQERVRVQAEILAVMEPVRGAATWASCENEAASLREVTKSIARLLTEAEHGG